MKLKIDSLDKRILHELDQNARVTTASIARKLNVKNDTVEYRIKRLETEEVILNHSVLVNLRALGMIVFKVYLNITGSQKAREEFISDLQKMPAFFWSVETYGRWNLNFSAVGSSPTVFNEELRNLIARHPDCVLDMQVITTSDALRFPRKYLAGKTADKLFRHFETREVKSLDPLELKLLRYLSNNGRANYTTLAEHCDCTPNIAKYRLEKLGRSGIISGYRPRLDYSKIGIMKFRVLVDRSEYSLESDLAILEFCKTQPKIVMVVRQLGMYDLEFEADVENIEDFNSLNQKFSTEFESSLRSSEFLIAQKNYKYSVPDVLVS